MRKLYFPAHANLDHKRSMAFRLALLITDHLVNTGKFNDVYFALKRYMKENKKYREKEDTDIKEENEFMKYVHAILAKEMENEQKGRVKSDTLTEEERNCLIKYAEKSEIRKMETWYWFLIGILQARGITPDEARATILKNLVEKGDLKSTRMMQEFPDKVHPVKTDDKLPPSPPLQPPSPM